MKVDRDKDFIPYRLIAKCILVGNAGVGKSSILQRIMGNEFNHNITSTIGVEYGTRTIPVSNDTSDSSAIKLQIWDAAGQERFRSIVQSYYRNTAVVLLVFDITNMPSLDSLHFWVEEIERIRGIQDGWPIFYLIGNKSDLSSEDPTAKTRTIFSDHVETLASKNFIRAYHEVSARDGTMIDDLLQEIADDIDRLLPEQREDYPLDTPNPYPGISFTHFEKLPRMLDDRRMGRAANQCC